MSAKSYILYAKWVSSGPSVAFTALTVRWFFGASLYDLRVLHGVGTAHMTAAVARRARRKQYRGTACGSNGDRRRHSPPALVAFRSEAVLCCACSRN